MAIYTKERCAKCMKPLTIKEALQPYMKSHRPDYTSKCCYPCILDWLNNLPINSKGISNDKSETVSK